MKLRGGWLCVLLAACATDPPAPAPVRAAAPQLMRAPGGGLFWANPQLFYPVPIQLRARAADACGALGLTPRGFHPGARGEDGKPLRGGGFYCVD